MCKLSDIFCCGCFGSKSGLDVSTTPDKKDKPTKSGKSTSSVKYGTNWETDLVQIKNMTPSEIADSLVTKQVKIDEKSYTNRLEWYKAIGNEWGFKFLEDQPIGRGGFGEVYKIMETSSGANRALKVMRLRSGKDEFSEARFKSFKNEIFSLRKTSHKNIIKLVDHFMVKEWLSFMIMEYANGGDLKKRLKVKYDKTKQGFAEDEAKRYFAQISNAMFFVHSNGLIHGDLKLENILLSVDANGKEVVKVTDFGCARVAYKESTGIQLKEKASGTIIYMSPEQIRVFVCMNMERPDLLKRVVKTYNPFRADIWSFGIVLYRLIFYDYPFNYEHRNMEETLPVMLKAMKKGIHPPKEIVEHLTEDCIDLLKGLLDYNKNNRIDISIVMKHKWFMKCPELDKIR